METKGSINSIDETFLKKVQHFIDTQFDTYPIVEIKLLENVAGFPTREYRNKMLEFYKKNQSKFAGVIFVNAPFHLNMTIRAAGLVYRGSIRKEISISYDHAIEKALAILNADIKNKYKETESKLEEKVEKPAADIKPKTVKILDQDIMAVSMFIANCIWDNDCTELGAHGSLPLPDDHPLTPILEAFVVANNDIVQLKKNLEIEKKRSSQMPHNICE